jgi:hypothetical protein
MCFHDTHFSYFPNEFEISHKIHASASGEVPNFNFISLSLNFQHIKSFRFVHVQEQNAQWWLESHNKKLTNHPLIIMLFEHHKW